MRESPIATVLKRNMKHGKHQEISMTPSLRVKCEILEAKYAAMPNGWTKKVLALVYDPNGLVARLISLRCGTSWLACGRD
jgi:hypothetical protein